MSLNLTTSSASAFESLTEGLRAMDRYYHSRRIPDIEQASECIDAALAHDSDYGLAIYYKGVVLDLIGKPADAPVCFERILSECDEPDLEVETRFNLGVVNYHRYGHQYLQRAKKYFDEVIAEAQDDKLKNLTRAHLAQTHAMWMIPSHRQLPDKRTPVPAEVCEHIEHHFKHCQTLVAELRQVEQKERRLIATYENANGMSNMYYTDHVAHEVSSRGKHLEIARDALLTAEKHLPDDWANTCDLGSVQLRLAVLACDREEHDQVDEHFSAAKDYRPSAGVRGPLECRRPRATWLLYDGVETISSKG